MESKKPIEPKIYLCYDSKGQATHGPTACLLLTGNFWKMGMGIIPQVYKRSALTIRIAPCFFLVKMLQFEKKDLFAYIPRGRIIGSDFFPFIVRRTLTFHRRHDERIDRSKWVRMFEGESMEKKGKGRKCLCQEYEGDLS